VIDSRAPRFNQAVIGTLALVAFLVDAEWLAALLGLQLAVGLVFGRQYCLPCLFYFEVVQPRIGEGRIEDARPPRFANVMGAGFLGAATLAFIAGLEAVGWGLTLLVAALALFAALSGICAGCEMYLWIARLRGRRVERYPRRDSVDPAEVGLSGAGVGVVAFSTPYCIPCRNWEAALAGSHVPFVKVDLGERPELARRYGVSATPLVLAVRLPGGEVIERYGGDPDPDDVARLRELAAGEPALA
jgi:hypothetical protein